MERILVNGANLSPTLWGSMDVKRLVDFEYYFVHSLVEKLPPVVLISSGEKLVYTGNEILALSWRHKRDVKAEVYEIGVDKFELPSGFTIKVNRSWTRGLKEDLNYARRNGVRTFEDLYNLSAEAFERFKQTSQPLIEYHSHSVAALPALR